MDVEWLAKLTDDLAQDYGRAIDAWMSPIVASLMKIPINLKDRKSIYFAADWLRRNGYSLAITTNTNLLETVYSFIRTSPDGTVKTLSTLKLTTKVETK